MAKNSGGAQMLVGSLRKQVQQVDASLDSCLRHCKTIIGLVKSPVLDLNGAQTIAKQMLETAKSAQKRVDSLYSAIRTVTEKMPKQERKSARKEIEGMLKKTDAKAVQLGKTAMTLVKQIQTKRQETPMPGPPAGFVVLLRVLQIVVLLATEWNKKKKKEGV